MIRLLVKRRGGRWAFPVTHATWNAISPKLTGGDLAFWESASLTAWALVADAPFRRRLPRDWRTLVDRVWNAMERPGEPITCAGESGINESGINESGSTKSGRSEPAWLCRTEHALDLEGVAAERRRAWAEYCETGGLSDSWLHWGFFRANAADVASWYQAYPDEITLPFWFTELESVDGDATSAFVQRVSGDDVHFPRPFPVAASTGWREFADRWDRLARLEHRFEEELERAKMEALKEFAYGASHEINNPLANIAGRAQSLLQDEAHPERRRTLATIAAEAFRAHDMIGDIMLVARPPELQLETVEAGKLIAEVVQSRVATLGDQGTAVSMELPGPRESDEYWMTVDPTHVRECLQLLIDNAAEALGQGGSIVLSLALGEEAIELSVVDDGPGIPDAIRSKIFEPYFSGREAGRGLGIGLSKCWVIASQHGGRIDCESRPGRTAFTFVLPYRFEE